MAYTNSRFNPKINLKFNLKLVKNIKIADKISVFFNTLLNSYHLHLISIIWSHFCFWLLVSTIYWQKEVLDFNFSISINQLLMVLLLIIISCLILHAHFNALHQASHRQLHKKGWLNNLLGNYFAFWCGLTFADFTYTHIQHHLYVGQPKKDPDYNISHNIANGLNLVISPFKIIYHDGWYLSAKWAKIKNNKQNLAIHLLQDKDLISYFLTRGLQISLISLLFISGYGQSWLIFWLIPMYMVGLLNSIFLFYLPHHQLPTNKNWLKKLGIISKFLILLADISRNSHQQHHQKINHTTAYYPISANLVKIIK